MVSLKKLGDYLSFFLSPPCCLHCKKALYERSHFCEDCFEKIQPIASYMLPIAINKGIKVHAISNYNQLLRPLVLSKRTKNVSGSYILADLMWQRTMFSQLMCDYLVPVPLHWTRRFMRGFNQANEIAAILAKRKGAAIAPILKRVQRTTYQADLPVQRRERNVAGAFSLSTNLDVKRYHGKHLVLIDDLMTTGNTLKYAARELFLLQPASVSAIVACRAS